MKKIFFLIAILLFTSCAPKAYTKQAYKYKSPLDRREKKLKRQACRDGLIMFLVIIGIGMEINHDSKK